MTSSDISDRLKRLRAEFPEMAAHVVEEVVATSPDEHTMLYRLCCREDAARDPWNELYAASHTDGQGHAADYSSLPTVKQVGQQGRRSVTEERIYCPACAERIEPKVKNAAEGHLECPHCSVAFSTLASKFAQAPPSRQNDTNSMRANRLYPCCDYCTQQMPQKELREHTLSKHARELEQMRRLKEVNRGMEERKPRLHEELAISILMSWRDILHEEVFAKMDDEATHKRKVDTAFQVESLVRAIFPGAVVYLFGSTTTGVSERGSDIDLAVKVSLNRTPPINEAAAVENLWKFFSREGMPWNTWWEGYGGDYGLRLITKTRVPILGNTPPLGSEPVDEDIEEGTRSLRWSVPKADIMLEQERIQKLGALVVRIDSGHITHATTDIIGVFPSPKAMLDVKMKEDVTHNVSLVSVSNMFRTHWDLSLKHFGIRNSLLLRKYFNTNYATKIAAVAVKIWSRKAGINNPKLGLLSSYAIMIMYVYYLLVTRRTPQWHPPKAIDPSVSPKESKPDYVGPPEDLASCLQGAAEQLLGFFEFYGYEFDWQTHVITLNKDPTKERVHKTQLQWTEEHAVIVDRANSIRYYVCIEDPYEAADQVGKDQPKIKGMLNLGRKVTEYRSRKMHIAFKQAYEAMCKPGPSMHDILGDNVRDIARMML